MDLMIAAVRENNIKMGCVYQRRTFPEYIAVKKAIDSGVLGKILIADLYMKYYRSQEYYDSAGWRGTWEFDGGGALMNQGVHGIDLLLWIMDDFQSVFSIAAALTRNIEVEDTAISVLKFKNGAFGVIEGTTAVFPARSLRMEIHGEKGTIIVGDKGILEWSVEGSDNKETSDIIKRYIPEYDDFQNRIEDPHFTIIKNLIDSIENNTEPMVTPEDARRSVDLVLAIYESAKRGEKIDSD
jgi:UDP-N-acetyl-2-amino-2-deoxyglucuronate dehydrogenase